MTRLPDAPARITAATDLEKGVVVVAGAGSGKTSLLIERLLGYLLKEDGSLSRACAITFTRKAAAEMLDRLAEEVRTVSKLGAGATADPATAAGRLWERLAPKERERAASASEDILGTMDEAQVSTIHAFCAGMLRRWPQAAKVSPGFSGDEGSALDLLIQRSGPDFLGDAMEKVGKKKLAALPSLRSQDLMEMVKTASKASPARGDANAPAAFAALGALAEVGGDILREALSREGWLSFDDILRRSRDLLRDHPDIRRLEQSRWDHLLVDELQDTDPVQYEILELLGKGCNAPCLFLVGDPKQSIYRFRSADLKAYEDFCGRMGSRGSRVVLTTNFRSHPSLLSPVNLLFEKTMVEKKGIQPSYDPVEPNPFSKEKGGGGPKVRVVNQPPTEDKEKVGHRREREARMVVGEILRMRGEGADWGGILVLLPMLKGLPSLTQAFHEAGIPFTAGGGKTFYKRQEVADFAALLTAAIGPDKAKEDHPAAVLAFLRSPLGGAQDREILAYRKSLPEDAAFGSAPPRPEDCPQVARVLANLEGWQRMTSTKPEDEIPRLLLDHSGLGLLWSLRKNGFQALANLEKAADTVSSLVRESGFSLSEAVRLLGDRLGSEDEADQGTSEEGMGAVSILTIHKAKGLEKEKVILAGIQEKPSRGKAGLKARPDSEGCWAIHINSKEKDARWKGLEAEDEAHERAQNLRLLYVAMTRAKAELVLIQTGGESEVKGNVWLETLASGWGFLPHEPAPEIPGVLFTGPGSGPMKSGEETTPPLGLQEAARAIEAWENSPAKPSPLNKNPSSLGHEAIGEAPSSGSPSSSNKDAALAAATGTLLHRLFELWDFQNWDSLRAPLEKEASALSAGEEVSLEDMGARARDILDRLPGTTLGVRLLELGEADRFPEIPMLHHRDGQAFHGFIDILYKEKDGPWTVADFKTDARLSAKDGAERYGKQLRLYGEAVQGTLGEAPELELFLLDTGVVANVPGQGADEG